MRYNYYHHSTSIHSVRDNRHQFWHSAGDWSQILARGKDCGHSEEKWDAVMALSWDAVGTLWQACVLKGPRPTVISTYLHSITIIWLCNWFESMQESSTQNFHVFQKPKSSWTKKIWAFQHRDSSIRPTHQPWTQQFPGILQSRPGSLVVAISCLMVCLRGLDSSRHPANIATLTILP